MTGKDALLPLEIDLTISAPCVTLDLSKAVNIDFSGGANGGVAEGRVMKVAGIELIPTPHFISGNINSGVDQGSATQGGSNPQAVNVSNYVAMICHPSAVGTVKLMDLATEMDMTLDVKVH